MGRTTTGSRTLAYTGVEALTPPNFTLHDRDPNTRDLGARVGDLWLNRGTNAAPLDRLFYLASKARSTAIWVLISASAAGPLLRLNPSVGGPVNPVLGVINFTNDDGNIVTTNDGANNLGFQFSPSIVVKNNITTINGNINASNNTLTIFGPVIGMQKSFGINGPVVPNSVLGNIIFAGLDPALNYSFGAEITSVVTGPINPAQIQANLAFWTTGAFGITQRVTISKDGNVLISAPDSGNALTVAGNIVTDPVGDIFITGNINNNIGPRIIFDKNRNNVGIVQRGDTLGRIIFQGMDTPGTYSPGALIFSEIPLTATVGAGRVPANLQFWTKPDAAVALTKRMSISEAGNVVINNPDTGDALTVQGNIVSNDGAASLGSVAIVPGGITQLAMTSNQPGSPAPGTVVSFNKVVGLLGAVTPNSTLGWLLFQGWDGAAFTQSALISCTATAAGTVGPGNVPAGFAFWTQPSGGPLTKRFSITDAGRIQSQGTIDVKGDDGGVLGAVTISATSDFTANGAGVFTIASKSANPLTSSGFLQIYINGTPFWIPLFSATAP